MIKFKTAMDRLFGAVEDIAKTICACFLIVMICTVSIQVVGRIFTFKIPVTEEVATYSLIWMTYIASIAVTIKGEHLTVDLLLSRYKPSQRRVVRVFVDVLLLVFCGMLMLFGFQLCRSPIIIRGRTPALQVSRVWIYLSVPIAMTVNSVFMVYDLLMAVYDLLSGGKLSAVDDARKAAEEAAVRESKAEEQAAVRAAMLGKEAAGTEGKEGK